MSKVNWHKKEFLLEKVKFGGVCKEKICAELQLLTPRASPRCLRAQSAPWSAKNPWPQSQGATKKGRKLLREGGGGRKGFNQSSDRKCCCHWGKGTGAESQQHQPHKPTVIHQKTHPKSSRRDENHRIRCVRWHLKDYLITTLWKFLFCEEHQQLFTIHSQKKKTPQFYYKNSSLLALGLNLDFVINVYYKGGFSQILK